MIRVRAVVFAVSAIALVVAPGTASDQKWYAKAVKKVEGRFAPAEAKPGQTVAFTLTVELHDGYHTYPTAQPDKQAAGMVNVIQFPAPGAVIFVGDTQDPKGFKSKQEPLLGIKEVRYHTGTVMYTRTAVVSPKATAGATTVKLAAFDLRVCDEDKCYAETVSVEAALKVLDGPATAVDKAHADEIAKVLGQK